MDEKFSAFPPIALLFARHHAINVVYTIHTPQAGRKEPFPMKLKSLLTFFALALMLCVTAAADGAIAAAQCKKA